MSFVYTGSLLRDVRYVPWMDCVISECNVVVDGGENQNARSNASNVGNPKIRMPTDFQSLSNLLLSFPIGVSAHQRKQPW